MWWCNVVRLTCDGWKEDGDEAEENVAAGHGGWVGCGCSIDVWVVN